MYDVITIGSATRDVFLRSTAWETHASDHSPTGFEQCLPLGAKVPIDELLFATGGGATNAAATFARLGKLRTAAICRIGSDLGAELILDELARDRVSTRYIQRDPVAQTGYSLILLSGSGERTILVYRGASEALAARAISWSRLRARWFALSSLGGDLALARKVLRHAQRHGSYVSWNPGGGELAPGLEKLQPLLCKATVCLLNREEAAALTRSKPDDVHGMLRKLCIECGIRRDVSVGRYVVLTDGAVGAYVCSGGSTWVGAARKIRARNTTGAGDAFGSAFVTGLAHGFAPEDALRLGLANAESVIQSMGAKAGILDRLPSLRALARFRVRALV